MKNRITSALIISAMLAFGVLVNPGQAQAASTTLSFNPVSHALAVGSDLSVNIDLDAVTSLFGYQFIVNYDSTKVSASGAFVDTWFDTTTQSFIVWNADCSTAGQCKFAVTKQVASGGEVNGTGTLATITFTGVAPGVVPLTFSSNKLSDRDGMPIAHTLGTGVINVYGFASFSGVVSLQGRATPIDIGSVTLSDASGEFAATTVNFNVTTGAWNASVPVTITGSTYNLLAAHSLYLGNQMLGVAVVAGASYPQAATRLKGGDANNSTVINVADLSCIGGAFGGAPALCGATGSSDINADGTTDIFDLTLAGGNYELTSPQMW